MNRLYHWDIGMSSTQICKEGQAEIGENEWDCTGRWVAVADPRGKRRAEVRPLQRKTTAAWV